MTDQLNLSPLDSRHRDAGARMLPFGGWDMPLSYPSGTVAEHLACREDAVVFDVSHLGTVRLTGDDAQAVLQRTLTNDLGKVSPGRAQYTHLLDPNDASVRDDIIVWWHPRGGTDVFDVMPNASNTAGVIAALGGEDVTRERALLAVQGPSAAAQLATVFPAASEVARFDVARCDWGEVPCLVAGTGYTGEPGVEIAVPTEAAGDLWDALLAAGVVPAGLGARDTLRLEAGLPLHGHELGAGITPLHAGLRWVVAWDKGDFVGRQALEQVRTTGVDRHLVGIATQGRRPPREGSRVLADGTEVGTVSSGNFSPVLGHGIALAFVTPEITVGAAVAVDVRGTELPGEVVKVPFVSS